MSSNFMGFFWLGWVVFILLVAVGGVLRRKAVLRDAQALAPGDFVFRFSTLSDFMDVLPKLPAVMRIAPLEGASRVGALSANSEGVVLWQVKTRLRLAHVEWSAVEAIRTGATTFPLGLSWRTYPTLFLDVNGDSHSLSLSLLSANAHYFWPRTSVDEVQQIADKLFELRAQAAGAAKR